MALLFRFIVNFIVLMLTAHFVPDLMIDNIYDAILFGVILSAILAVIRPILTLVTLPINIFSLGLFSLVINVFLFWVGGEISYGIHILNFWGAFWGGFIMWVVSFFTNLYITHSNLH